MVILSISRSHKPLKNSTKLRNSAAPKTQISSLYILNHHHHTHQWPQQTTSHSWAAERKKRLTVHTQPLLLIFILLPGRLLLLLRQLLLHQVLQQGIVLMDGHKPITLLSGHDFCQQHILVVVGTKQTERGWSLGYQRIKLQQDNREVQVCSVIRDMKTEGEPSLLSADQVLVGL